MARRNGVEELASTSEAMIPWYRLQQRRKAQRSPLFVAPQRGHSRRVRLPRRARTRSYSLYLGASRIVLYILVCFKSRASPNSLMIFLDGTVGESRLSH